MLYDYLMLNDEDTTTVTNSAIDAARLKTEAIEAADARDGIIRQALAMDGVGVAEIVKATGLTRARIYQIRDRRR